MRLAFDAKRLFNNFTGLGNYSRTLVKNLHTYYPDIDIHLFTPKIHVNDETSFFLEENRFKIHVPKISYPMWREIGMSGLINEIQPDIYHGLSHELPFGLKSSIKKVVTFHDLIYNIYPKQFNCWDRNMYALKYKSAAVRADKIIAISQSTATDLKRLYKINENKISVVYQSCSTDFQVEAEKDSALGNYYLYVGSIIERKGLLNIVFAYSKLPKEFQLPFVVIGNGPKEYRQKVDKMIEYYGLKDKFKFLNALSNSELLEYYKSSLCLVYPSIYEGFGIPLIESLFSGIPVITSDVSSLPEASGPGALYAQPNDVSALQKAMLSIHDKKIHHRLSVDGRQYVWKNFSSKVTADALFSEYSSLMH
ncbi:MAG: glycosyltransferase family 1 protein [Saprospiraceae bacterium]